MKISVDSTCYTHLLWMLTFRAQEFASAVRKHECTQPEFGAEGLNGYIACKIVFEVSDISLFAKIYNEWYVADNRSNFYCQVVNKRCS